MYKKLLEPKTYRVSFAISSLLKYGYFYKRELSNDFGSSNKTTIRDVKLVKETVYDLYGGDVKWNKKTKRYELKNREEVLNNLIIS